MNRKERTVRRMLRLNDHAAVFGPLYLLWRGEFRACLCWYALPAALLVLAHGALSWGVGHALPLLAQGAGYAMAACRDPSVPCHRVMGKGGALREAAFAPGAQRALLEAEGVPFCPDGRVDLSRCRWDGT